MRQIARLGPDRHHRAIEPVTILALVLVGHAIADRLTLRRRDIDTCAGDGEPRIGLILVPQIGQRQPAVGAVQQHTRFDQAALGALAEGKGLDERRAHRDVEQAFAVGPHRRAVGQIEETQLVRPVRIERRVEPVWRDARHRLLRARILKKAVGGQRARQSGAADHRVGIACRPGCGGRRHRRHGAQQRRPEDGVTDHAPRRCSSSAGAPIAPKSQGWP